MSKLSVPSLVVLCAALAACSDGATNRTLTAPDARPRFSEAQADLSVGFTADGPFDRQVVVRLTGPPDRAAELQKVANSGYDAVR